MTRVLGRGHRLWDGFCRRDVRRVGVLRIDGSAQLTGFSGRPQFLLDDTEPVRELLGN